MSDAGSGRSSYSGHSSRSGRSNRSERNGWVSGSGGICLVVVRVGGARRVLVVLRVGGVMGV